MSKIKNILFGSIIAMASISLYAMEQPSIEFPVIFRNHLTGRTYNVPIKVTYKKGEKDYSQVIQPNSGKEFTKKQLAGMGDEFTVEGYGTAKAWSIFGDKISKRNAY